MKILLLPLSLVLLGSCAGVQTTDTTFVAHAESIAIFGMELPGDDLAAAEDLVPQGAKIETVISLPDDWTSVMGILQNIFGIQMTTISGTL